MIKGLKFEFSRAFKSKGFWISLAIGIVFCITQQVDYNLTYNNVAGHVSAIQAFVGYDMFRVFNSIFVTLFPIVAVVPYAASYYSDLNSGYIKNICSNLSRKQYYVAKCVTVFISAALVIIVPLIINIMIAMTQYPMIVPEKFFFMGVSMDSYVFSYTFNTNPGLYILIYVLIDGFFAGLFALISVCVTEFTESVFIALTCPFAIYMLSSSILVFGTKGDGNYSMQMLLNPCQMAAGEEMNLFIIAMSLIVFIVLSIGLRIKRKDLL